MPIKKLPDGRYEVDARPDGSWGYRTRRIFKTKNEVQHYHSQVMGKAALGEVAKPAKHDPRTLLDLVNRWYAVHGNNLKTGEERLSMLTAMVNRMGNPRLRSSRRRILLNTGLIALRVSTRGRRPALAFASRMRRPNRLAPIRSIMN